MVTVFARRALPTSVDGAKVYLSSVEGPNRRGRPLGRWEDRVKEYLSERR